MSGCDLFIETDEFACSDTEVVPRALIHIGNIGSITMNGEALDVFVEDGDYFDIHTLQETAAGVELHGTWTFEVAGGKWHWESYVFAGATLHVQALDGGSLVPFEDPGHELLA